jgi:hypothetical protein
MAGPDMRSVMRDINTIQLGLTITPLTEAPDVSGVNRVYKYWPSSAHSISAADTPCFINEWTTPRISFLPSMMRTEAIVHMQLLYFNGDNDVAADVVTAFLPKIAEAFAGNIKLKADVAVNIGALRGRNPTLALLSFAGMDFVGLDFDLDLHFTDEQVNSPGTAP